ncbi:MAG: NUDIX domain-containing protein [Carboxydocellales bacterium]
MDTVISFNISIHSIIRKENQFLITKRPATANFGANLWDTPGGALEVGEQPEAGLVREIREETGLTINVEKPLTVYSKLVKEREKQIVCLVFLCEYLSGEVNLSVEHVEYRWVNREEAAQLPLVDYLQRALVDLDKIF